MSSRPYIVHRVSTTEPTGQQLGDEWYNPTTNTLTKTLAVSGNAVTSSSVVTVINGNAAVSGNISVTDLASFGNGVVAAGSSGLVVNAIGTEGGQITLTYPNITGASTQVNSSWNVDVDNTSTFRIFTVYANSTPAVPFTITSTNPTFTMAGNVNMTAALGVGTTSYGNTGEIRATNNITAFFSSDARFKSNVAPIENALSIVCAVGGKTFDWTDEYMTSHGGADDYFMQKSDFGVIAQDLQKVFPQAVRTRPDGSLAVDYEKLVAVAFQAIVELQAEIQTLKKGS